MRGMWYAIFGMPTWDMAIGQTESEPSSAGASPSRPLLGRDDWRPRSGSTVKVNVLALNMFLYLYKNILKYVSVSLSFASNYSLS